MLCCIIKEHLIPVNFSMSDRNDVESLGQCSLGVVHS